MAKSWTGTERMRVAMSGGEADRVPTMPQICHVHAVSVFYDDFRQGIAETMEDPSLIDELMLKIAGHYGVDGLRIFLTPEAVKVKDDGETMVAFDAETGKRLGRVDVMGGASVIPDEPVLRIESTADLKKIPRVRCEELSGQGQYERLRQSTARAQKLGFFVASAPADFVMAAVISYRGREQAYMDMVMEPGLVKGIIEIEMGNAIEQAKAMLTCGIDALYIGDPSSSCSLISPQHWEEFCLPVYRTFCEELHKQNILIYVHVCGNSRPILEMMADTGADCIEPLDPLGGVEVADAKRRVGDRVALMGGVNTLTLFRGSPEDVYEESMACCRAGAEGGGYILAAGDMVPDRSPEENVRAMVRAARDFRSNEVSK